MYNRESKIGKQVLAWALVFALTLSVIPTAVADEADDEWFYDIYEDVYDEDGDGSDDTIYIEYDPDTECDCDIDIIVYVDIYDEDGYVDYIYDEHTINNGEWDQFSQDWTPDYDGTFDFYVEMYDEWNNLEDNWNVTDIELSPMTGSPPASDDTINVDNYVGADDEDGVNNDISLFAHNEDDGIEEVEISVEYFNGLNWAYYANGTTDDGGDYTVYNASSGEYRWTASYNGTDLEEETVSYTEVDTVNNLSHLMSVEDWDGANDYDDFIGAIFEDDGTKDDGYVEVYDEAGDLYDSGNTDQDYYGSDIYLLDDVEKGNYTFNLYYEEDGELLQSGWLYSFGSTSTNYDEWFEDWEYETEDTNGDGVANSIITKYDPNTECNCTVDIEVDFDVYNNDTGGYDGGDYYDHEINGTEVDSFETDEWSPSKNGNYTFEFNMYDEDYNYEDSFNFTVYLECDNDSNDSDCDIDEWFEDWDYETEDTDGDNLVDTIDISYDPNTDCDCEMDVEVAVNVYENSTDDWVDSESDIHTINGTVEEYFEQSWTTHESQSYDFYVYLYDDEWNIEDSFQIYNVYLYQASGAGGPGDEDEYFDYIDAYVYDDDGDGYDDTAEIDYDPDTTCDCDINITLVIDIYDNETGYWVNGTEEDYTIYSDDDDYWYQEWSPEYNGTFDFYVELYDEDGNLEDEEEYMNISLHARSSGGGGDDDYDEYFYDWDYDVDPSDKITIGYDPDTECDCEIEIDVYVEVYENETGGYVDYIYATHTIYNGYSDWFTQDWTSWNDDYYDFWVYIYDPEYNQVEDEFWIYDVYLSSDDGGGGNQTDDDNGVGHMGVIDNFDDDDYVNDYIGAVIENDEYKENAYFEIYDENGNLVDSGNPNYYGMLFVSSNLTEGWYYQDVYYQEDDAMLQTGLFYSYGNSTEFEVVNVDNIVIDDDEWEVYDDVGFKAHQGNFDSGVANVGIEINKYNHSTEEWDSHAYVETNETGEAWLYNETCGEYEWFASTDDEKGYYEVWAHCDDDNGGGGGDEDHDEYFYDWGYDVGPSDTITIGYDPDTDCDCDIEIEVYIDVFDNNTGDYIDSIYDEHTINNGEGDWFEQHWTSWNDATYDFYVYIYDQEYGHEEDDFWIYDVYLSSDDGGNQTDDDYDEQFYNWDYYGTEEPEWNKLIIAYDPDTDCDCDVDVEVYIDVFDNETGDHAGSLYGDHTIFNGDSDWFEQEWTADYAGKYDFYVELYDPEYGHSEDNFMFSLIMSDESFDSDFGQEDATVYIDLDPRTDYEGEIETHYYLDVFRLNENDEWEWIDNQVIYDVSIDGSNDNEDIHFEWTAEEGGKYRFEVWMEDEYWNGEDWADFEAEINLNSAPIIEDLVLSNDLYEGNMNKIEVMVMDDDADLVISWDMGDGKSYDNAGDNVLHMYMDNGIYEVTITADDGTYITEKTFEIKVYNVAPTIDDVMFDKLGNEGDTISFNALVSDPSPSDMVLVTWTFPDGSTADSSFAQYVFTDDGEFIVLVTASDGEDTTTEQIMVTVENVAPIFTEFVMPSTGQEGEALDFNIAASDPGDDTIVYNVDFGDGTSPLTTQDGGNITHKFAEGDTFTIKICATDEDGGETCREQILPVSILEQLEDSGLPGFNLLAVISALGVISILRRRTH